MVCGVAYVAAAAVVVVKAAVARSVCLAGCAYPVPNGRHDVLVAKEAAAAVVVGCAFIVVPFHQAPCAHIVMGGADKGARCLAAVSRRGHARSAFRVAGGKFAYAAAGVALQALAAAVP